MTPTPCFSISGYVFFFIAFNAGTLNHYLFRHLRYINLSAPKNLYIHLVLEINEIAKKTGTKAYKNKDYHKWVVVLPSDEIITAGFKEGDELKALASEGKIIITKNNAD